MRADKHNSSSGMYRKEHVEGTIGSYYGLSIEAPSVSSNACTLVVNAINTPAYTGAAALTATLPAANAGAVCVYNFKEDPRGGTSTLTWDCAGSDVFETGCVIPTSSSNALTWDASVADETSLVFTPTNDSVNILSYGSTVEFVCERDGYWYVNIGHWNPDAGVTNGAATGTLAFAS